MKVFVSSTCYDLIDLRAELHEDLRDLGVEALFSDLKESDFETKGDPKANSIETCLENLRGSDVVVVILSERYGPILKRGYGDISATHLEYREAQNTGKRVLFYIRDRLVADWTGWKKNGRPKDYSPTWAGSAEDAAGLFTLIHEHQKLVGGGDEPGANNWYWQYRTSVDLRADLRKRLEAQAYRATAEKLIRTGQVPILLVVEHGLTSFPQSNTLGSHVFRFEFGVVNAGTAPAMSVQGDLVLPGDHTFGGNDSRAGAVLPGNPDKAVKISFDVPDRFVERVFSEDAGRGICRLCFGYCLPSGHVMQDRFQVRLIRRGTVVQFECLPLYEGKGIAGVRNLIMD